MCWYGEYWIRWKNLSCELIWKVTMRIIFLRIRLICWPNHLDKRYVEPFNQTAEHNWRSKNKTFYNNNHYQSSTLWTNLPGRPCCILKNLSYLWRGIMNIGMSWFVVYKIHVVVVRNYRLQKSEPNFITDPNSR